MNRRALLTALALALAPVTAGCRRSAIAGTPPVSLPPLRTITPGAFGTCVQLANLTDPAWLDLARTHVSQLTPEWEMKMEYILADGLDRLRLDRADRIVRFAHDHNMALHGHTLIWYAQGEDVFAGLDNAAFDRAFDGYIATVAGRYRGKVRSWDVVNEPILDDGSGLRDCHWSRRYGQDGYILRAFEKAHIADPDAVLFLNEYNLEGVPAKGSQFLRLVERLLRAGCPLQGIGTQSHLWIDIPDGQIADSMHELAGFGLPIHVSELDVSLRTGDRLDLRGQQERLARQTARVTELAGAYMGLPPAQQFAFTTWGLRDTDSWFRRGDKDDGKDRPLPFDAAGRANPMATALTAAFQV